MVELSGSCAPTPPASDKTKQGIPASSNKRAKPKRGCIQTSCLSWVRGYNQRENYTATSTTELGKIGPWRPAPSLLSFGNRPPWNARSTVCSDFWSVLALDSNTITCSRSEAGKAEGCTPLRLICWKPAENAFWWRLAAAHNGFATQKQQARSTLKKGRSQQSYRLRPVADAEKPELLKGYLDSFKTTVQRYFPIPAGSPAQAFASVACELSDI